MSFADVTSANVVGYDNLKLNAGGKNLLGPNMLTIGTKEQIRLSDLKITGYEEAYLEDMDFSLTFQRRMTSGMPESEYQWADMSDMEVWEGGKWKNLKTGQFLSKDNDVTIGPGEAFWVTVP